MTAAIMPLEDVYALADQIVQPCVSQLSELEVISLKGRISRAIIHAQTDAAEIAIKELAGRTRQ